jgi:hypothetical protein
MFDDMVGKDEVEPVLAGSQIFDNIRRSKLHPRQIPDAVGQPVIPIDGENLSVRCGGAQKQQFESIPAPDIENRPGLRVYVPHLPCQPVKDRSQRFAGKAYATKIRPHAFFHLRAQGKLFSRISLDLAAGRRLARGYHVREARQYVLIHILARAVQEGEGLHIAMPTFLPKRQDDRRLWRESDTLHCVSDPGFVRWRRLQACPR